MTPQPRERAITPLGWIVLGCLLFTLFATWLFGFSVGRLSVAAVSPDAGVPSGCRCAASNP